jgi:hypothetical protein
MQKAFGDYMQQVTRGQRGDWTLPETAETNVVWLIAQRCVGALGGIRKR